MRIVLLLHLLFLLPYLVWSLELEHRQKRQLDWNGGGKVYNYDHLAVSSDQDEVEEVYVAPAAYSPSGLPGEPGIDYPILPSIPLTDFHCRGRVPGFYGDTQTACQVFHVCDMSGRQDSFLCPNGTIFSQQLFACDWWYNVKCSATRQHYQLNSNLFKGSNLNLYGTPSFWNWLTETEEVYPKPGSTRPPPTLQSPPAYQKPRPKYVANPAPVIPILEQVQIQQTPEVQQFHHIQEVHQVQPIQHPQVFQSDPTLQPELITPSPEVFVPSVEPVPIIVAVTAPPPSIEETEGFTASDYGEHFGWVNDAVHPPSADMVPELSWADLGPNGPLMSDMDHIPTPVVDRRRKAKPIQSPKPVVPVKKQQPSARQAPPPVAQPVFVAKPVPIKKLIPEPSPKYFVSPAPTAQPKFVSFKPKFTASPQIASTFSPIFTPSTPLPPKQKPITQKPVKKLTQHTVTKTTTTIRPQANTDYFYDDDIYDDSPIKPTKKPSQKSRADIKSRPDISSSSSKKSKTHQTKFVPSSKITASRSDDLIAKNYIRAARVIQPQTTPSSVVQQRQQPPLWNKQSAQSRLKSVSARLPWKSSQIAPVTTTGRPVVPSPTSGKPIHQPDARSFRQLTTPSGVIMERLSPTFRPSRPIPAVTTNSNQPRVRAQRAHPSSPPANGVKRKRSKKTSSVAYDPRLGRAYGQNHPIYKLQNWESTKV